MDREPMTPKGEHQLREELKQLVGRDRPAVVQAIAEARAHGDLKENAEYHAARERQGFIERRIHDIEGKLSRAQIIDVTRISNSKKVIFGATVTVRDHDQQEDKVYVIVGQDEANAEAGLISYASPMARSMIGKLEGDQVTIELPGGSRTYTIVMVAYL